MTARDWTTLKVTRTTKEALDQVRVPGYPETYDQIIVRLLNERESKKRLKW